MSRNKFLAIFSLFVILSSCKKENSQIPPPPPEILTAAQAKKVNVLKDVSTILLEVYKDPVALFEVNAAIYSEYYADETVLLKDLLYPEASKIYTSEKFKSIKAPKGVFRARFIEQFNKGEFPFLKEALGKASGDFMQNGLSAPGPAVPDTAMEIFSNSSGVSIYFPYSENWGSYFTPTWFDNVNTDPFGVLATIVTTDRNANSAPGQSARKTYVNNEPTIRYVSVTVDDVYADKFMTHIVGIGAEPETQMQPPPVLPPPGINRVFIGEAKINGVQYDNFINLNGNAGGSEIKICHLTAFLQPVSGQVSTFQDIISVNLKRKDIKNKRWKRVYGVWDDDWQLADAEQYFAIYEEDRTGSITITGSVSTTLTISTGNTVTGNIGFSVTRPSEDAIIRQLKISRNSYFQGAYQSQGGDFSSDVTFMLPPIVHGWPIYDQYANVSWTWPYNSY